MSSSARYSTGPASTGTEPSASVPAATFRARPSDSHDLPTFGGPASRFTPSARNPGTAHRGGANCIAMSSSAVHDVRSRWGSPAAPRVAGPDDPEPGGGFAHAATLRGRGAPALSPDAMVRAVSPGRWPTCPAASVSQAVTSASLSAPPATSCPSATAAR